MDQFERELTGLYPALRNFAYSLAKNADLADDLVQETMMKALKYRHAFTVGTNMRAWAFVIMRNYFYTEMRKHRNHLTLDDPEYPVADMQTSGSQLDSLELKEALSVIDSFEPHMREALQLVGIEGRQYEEAAEMAGTKLGTIKSRVSRARAALHRELAAPSKPKVLSPVSRVVVPFRDRKPALRTSVKAARSVILPENGALQTPVGPLETLRSLGFPLRLAETRENDGFRLRTFALE